MIAGALAAPAGPVAPLVGAGIGGMLGSVGQEAMKPEGAPPTQMNMSPFVTAAIKAGSMQQQAPQPDQSLFDAATAPQGPAAGAWSQQAAGSLLPQVRQPGFGMVQQQFQLPVQQPWWQQKPMMGY